MTCIDVIQKKISAYLSRLLELKVNGESGNTVIVKNMIDLSRWKSDYSLMIFHIDRTWSGAM